MNKSIGESCRSSVGAAHREFLARARRAISGNRHGELHAARIAAKRLRYTLEFYGSVIGPASVTALGLLALLQDRIGSIADDEAFDRFYTALLRRMHADDTRRAGIEQRIAVCDAHRREAIEAVSALWNGGEYPPYPDMLAASISASLRSLSNDT